MDRIDYRYEKIHDGNGTIIVSANGRELPLHSRRNPMREGRVSQNSPNPEKYDVLVILGFGLGYSFMGDMESFGQFEKIYVVDILEGVEKHIGVNGATSRFCELENLQFITGREPFALYDFFKDRLDFSSIRGVQVLEHGASLRVFPEYYENIREILLRLINEKGRNAATSKKFGRLFFRNAMLNLLGGDDLVPVSNLFGKFSGGDCLIVSSAPSVEDSLGTICKFRDSFAIVAVDSAMPVLEAWGVVPDFVVSIDPQRVIGEHLLGMEDLPTRYICSAVSPPAIIKKTGAFISLNSHPLAQIFDQLSGGRVGSVDSSTGSVAGDALNFAIKAGFDKIGMVGFDFSFSGNKIYSRGSAYQKRYGSLFNNRLHTAETFNADYIFRSSNSLLHKGRYTRRAFLDYRDSLGKLTSTRDELFFINKIAEDYVPENMVLTDMDSFIALGGGHVGKLREEDVPASKFHCGEVTHRCMELFKSDEFLEEVVANALGTERKGDNMDYARRLIAGVLGG